VADTNLSEGHSTRDYYSGVDSPHALSLTDSPVNCNPQIIGQDAVMPSGYSITSTSTTNDSFSNQRYNFSSESREAGADVGMLGEMTGYVTIPAM
jgi:hypothetical protein